MGRDLTLYPKSASKADLKKYLEGLGFIRCEHLWDWPAGTLNYSWFDEEDFRSVDGVSADIYPVDGDEAELATRGWALHVRNLYSASWHDVKMLNDVLRGARKRFGGTIRGDYGTNRYAPLWEDQSTPISRGIAVVYHHVATDLGTLRFALPKHIMMPLKVPENAREQRLVDHLQAYDPTRVIYNGLVPFAVAMFEYFFAGVFRVLIKYDEHAIARRASYKQRVDFATLCEVGSNVRTVEDVIASTYTFQNLNQLNKAYKDWLNIDVRKILFKRKRIGRSVTFLENRIADIIQYRHGVVHRFELDRSLSREGYLEILDAVEKCISEVLAHLEKRYSMKVSRH